MDIRECPGAMNVRRAAAQRLLNYHDYLQLDKVLSAQVTLKDIFFRARKGKVATLPAVYIVFIGIPVVG